MLKIYKISCMRDINSTERRFFMSISLIILITAFCGGIIGALTGAFQACMLAGFIGILTACFPESTLLSGIFSTGFIPYISFGGGVAATAYASKIRKHNLKGADILKSLNFTNDFSVLIVSGIFAVLGYTMAWAVNKSGFKCDAGSISCIVSAVIVRIIFGDKKFFNKNMKSISRYTTNKREWIYIALFGLAIAFMASYIVQKTGNTFLPFYLSLFSLMFYFIDPNFPPSHHITCIAGYAFAASGSLFWGAFWGMIAAVVSILLQDSINTDASTHIDPPATTIGLLSIIIFLIF